MFSRFILFLSLALILPNILVAQSKTLDPWTNFEELKRSYENIERQIIPNKYRTIQVDRQKLIGYLEDAPLRFTEEVEQIEKTIVLPFPDGTKQAFRIFEAPVMHPDLAKKFPNIKTYSGYQVDQPQHYLRLEVMPDGIHAMVQGGKDQIFIDPYGKGNNELHIAYSKRDFSDTNRRTMQCGFDTQKNTQKSLPTDQNLLAGDCQFRKYRLALACTGEYASFHGGTVELVLEAMVVAMARVNGVYEREFSVTMELIPNNDELIFFNRNTDPYTNNEGGIMLGENQNVVDSRIGRNNYDIGHVFSTGEGGIASLGSVCRNGSKARGVTGRNRPINDPFTIDFVAHEMGHQFGGSHTQGNGCQRVADAAVEPGSGSTIMAYAGICPPNVQFNSDDYFHAYSLSEISSNLVFGTANNCPEIISTDNTPPIIENITNYFVPVATPFMLTAQATDDNGDSLTYCWEQMNNEFVPQPPRSTSTSGPSFRSFIPVPSPTRFFPRLEDLVNNTEDDWEVLPDVSRQMNFRCTVRDNHPRGGCTDETNTELTFTNTAGPFIVSDPNTFESWSINDFEMVRWDVADTDLAPINCSHVNLLLSTDGGFTYPDILARNVPNTGAAEVLVPNRPSTTCRVMAAGVDNIFFDISNENFEIRSAPQPGIVMRSAPTSLAICGSDDATFEIIVNYLGELDESVIMSSTGLPAGTVSEFDIDTLSTSSQVVLSLSELQNARPENYLITVFANASNAAVVDSIELELNIVPAAPPSPELTFPENLAVDFSSGDSLIWNSIPTAASYIVEIATSPDFVNDRVDSVGTSTPFYIPSGLVSAEVYYWRVIAINACGQTVSESFNAFQVLNNQCVDNRSFNVPVIMTSSAVRTYSSILTINSNQTIADIDIFVDVNHRRIGDLIFSLVSPDLDTFLLSDRPDYPLFEDGCEGDDMVVTFDDEAMASAQDFEEACNELMEPAIEGRYQPIDPLLSLSGKSANGEWQLIFSDEQSGSGGFLNDWTVIICEEAGQASAPSILTNNTLKIVRGDSSEIDDIYLEATKRDLVADDFDFIITALPAFGQLLIDGNIVVEGTTFTQSDINEGKLSYRHDGVSTSNEDRFLFDLIDRENGWLPSNQFNIEIIDPGMIGVSSLILSKVLCNNDSTGSILAIPLGGQAPYTYSLNGGTPQTDSVFTALNSGTYIVSVSDASMAVTMDTVMLENPFPITAGTMVTFRELVITASGGTGRYQYSIDGANFQDEAVFTNLANGTYNVIIRDENNCITEIEVSINVPELSGNLLKIDEISCFGENDGSIEMQPAGGIRSYEYSLNGIDYFSDSLFSNLVANNYAVIVRDSIGQLFRSNTVTLANPPELEIETFVEGDSLSLGATGGNGAYEFSFDGMPYSLDTIFTNVDNGTYIVRVRDENDCVDSTEVTIISVGTGDLLNELDITISPNPTVGTFTIEIAGLVTTSLQVLIYDAVGQEVTRRVILPGQITAQYNFDLRALPAGVYYIRIGNEQLLSTHQLVIIR